MNKAAKHEQGQGTTRAIINRRTGEISGYKAILPREHSRVPSKVKNPKNYQEALPGLFPSEAEARAVLIEAVQARIEKRHVPAGADFSYYVTTEIASRLQDAKRDYGDTARARRQVKRFKSVNRCWFSKAPFYSWRPAIIGRAELQAWFNEIRDTGLNDKGEPLGVLYIQSIRTLTKAVFARAGIDPNPAEGLTIPKSKKTKTPPFLPVPAIRRFFGDESIAEEDRLMVACGMGAGLRVGELLAMEPGDVCLDDHDPHLMIRFGGPDHSPTKGKRVRRVEMFEPGLSAWRVWMRDFYKGGDLVFAGPSGGYRWHWPDKFKGWAAAAGQRKLTSHIMRHTYAVALLNGSWGYEPQSMGYVSRQLGHSSIKVTEDYYAAWEVGSAAKETRVMTRREARPALPLTASDLFGFDAPADAPKSTTEPYLARLSRAAGDGRQPPFSCDRAENTPDCLGSDAATHHVLTEIARAVLVADEVGEETAFRNLAVDLATRLLGEATG